MPREPLVLHHKWALGDAVLFTALVRDIQLTHPGRFEVLVESHFREVWVNNPYARVLNKDDHKRPGFKRISAVKVSYHNGIRAAGRGEKVHMLSWFHRDFSEKTGVEVVPTLPHGDIHLTAEEMVPKVTGRYWVILAGGKMDITNKFWWPSSWQSVIDQLLDMGIHCVQAGATHRRHVHYDLRHCTNLVGKLKSSREFFNLIANCEGVICPVTSAMHIAACYQKPCVVIAGGREEPWWEAYSDTYGAFGEKCQPVIVPHQFLHTVGLLDCCDKKGCWKRLTEVQETRNPKLRKHQQEDLCYHPVSKDMRLIPQCMDMITPGHVVDAVMSYEKDGTIPPIKPRSSNDSIDPKLLPIEKIRRLIDVSKDPAAAPQIVRPPAIVAAPAVVTAPAVETVIEITGDGEPPPVKRVAVKKSRDVVFDNPIIGGKLTIFVMCYGGYTELAKTCINSIFETLSQDRIDLRVACNQVVPGTLEYLKTMPITKIYVDKGNRRKYQAMRQMFHDSQCPIRSNYVVWFDDDAKAVTMDWAHRLANLIIDRHPHGDRLFGWRMFHNAQRYASNGHRPLEWFRQGKWFHGRHFRISPGKAIEAPNGSVISFVSGWFWALSASTIQQADIPDRRLNHNGGDITIGEQVHQAGYGIGMFNQDKAHIWCPPKHGRPFPGRRGFEEAFPWSKT